MIDSNNIETIIDLNEDMFSWCLRNAERSYSLNNLEDVLKWAEVAAKSASFGAWRKACSGEIEDILIKLARSLQIPHKNRVRKTKRLRCLHVLSKTYSTGGHIALLARWISLDLANRHTVVITSHEGDIPDNLVELTKTYDCQIHPFNKHELFFQRAHDLRVHAWDNADVVILHTDPWDVIPIVAFGVDGGPPVLLMNHADHIFWIGGSVSDVVLNFRNYGKMIAETYRGIETTAILPLPLCKKNFCENDKKNARLLLGIPDGADVLLTISEEYKLLPHGNINFLEAIRLIYKLRPDVYMLLVGPENTGSYLELCLETNGRFRAFGKQKDLTIFHEAADLYLEGFPLGSLTAVLEVALSGINIVRAPKICPPHFGADDPAFATCVQPNDIEAYANTVLKFLEDKKLSAQHGQRLSQSVDMIHCGTNWADQLHNILMQMPTTHTVKAIKSTQNLPNDHYLFVSSTLIHRDIVGHAVYEACLLNLKVQNDTKLSRSTNIKLLHVAMTWYIDNDDFVNARRTSRNILLTDPMLVINTDTAMLIFKSLLNLKIIRLVGKIIRGINKVMSII